MPIGKTLISGGRIIEGLMPPVDVDILGRVPGIESVESAAQRLMRSTL